MKKLIRRISLNPGNEQSDTIEKAIVNYGEMTFSIDFTSEHSYFPVTDCCHSIFYHDDIISCWSCDKVFDYMNDRSFYLGYTWPLPANETELQYYNLHDDEETINDLIKFANNFYPPFDSILIANDINQFMQDLSIKLSTNPENFKKYVQDLNSKGVLNP